MADILVMSRALKLPLLKASTQEARLAQPVFTDVQPGHWAYAEIISAHA
ncbi:hypothetical protein ACLGL1_01080 [Peptococcus simiae]